MAIRQRGSSWQADITVKGRRYRETFESKEDAEAWELEAKAAILKGKTPPKPSGVFSSSNGPRKGSVADEKRYHKSSGAGSVTLADAAARVHAKYWAGTPSDRNTLITIGLLEEHFGASRPVGTIDTDAIDGFIEACIAKGNSNGTINRKLACLSKILRYCEDRGIIDKKPKIDRKKEGVGRIRWLSQQEENTILGYLRQWGKYDHVDVVTCLIDTGFRNSELFKLTNSANEIDLKRGTITLWKTKTDHPRTIYMTKRVKEIIERRVESTAPGQLLFPYDNFWLRNVWDRIRSLMGMSADPHFVPYICRHTCASRLVQRGVALPVVKEWMGHKTIQMTMRYAHLAPANLKAAAEILESAE